MPIANKILVIEVKHFTSFAYYGNKEKTAIKEINNVIGQEVVDFARRSIINNLRGFGSPFNPTDNLRSTKGMAGIASSYKFKSVENGVEIFSRSGKKLPYSWVQEKGKVIYAKKPIKAYYITDKISNEVKLIVTGGLFIPFNTNVNTIPKNICNLIYGIDYIKSPLAVIPARLTLAKAIQQVIHNTSSPEHERVIAKIKQALSNLMRGPIHAE
jgi:hypothetical protein